MAGIGQGEAAVGHLTGRGITGATVTSVQWR
jgi:hypothetical protein